MPQEDPRLASCPNNPQLGLQPQTGGSAIPRDPVPPSGEGVPQPGAAQPPPIRHRERNAGGEGVEGEDYPVQGPLHAVQ